VRWKINLFCAALIAVLGCGESTEPDVELVLTMQNLSGLYFGVTFTTEEGGVVTDQLRLGATIELFLYSDGRTDGRLFIPGDPGGLPAADVSLIGSWGLDGNIVTLDLTNDSFLKQMSLEFEETHLTGETTLGAVTHRVVLAL
jgi:hypothetical protein